MALQVALQQVPVPLARLRTKTLRAPLLRAAVAVERAAHAALHLATFWYSSFATDFARMPKIGSSVIDGDGVALIDAWIGQLPKGCPP